MEEVEQQIILAEVEMEAEHHLAGSKLGLRYTSAVSMVAPTCQFMVSIQRAVVLNESLVSMVQLRTMRMSNTFFV